VYLPPLLLRLQRLHKREFGLHRFAVLCTYQEANFAYERAFGVGFSADKFLRKKNKSTQIKSNGARASVKLLHIIIML
jgi:hypothetical protein